MVQIRSLLAAVALVSLPGLLQAAFGVPVSGCGSVDRVIVALRFVQALFPELKGKEFSVSFSPGHGTFVSGPTDADNLTIRFDKHIWHPPGEPDVALSSASASDGIELPFYLYFSFIDVRSGSAEHRQLACRPLEFTSTAGHTQMEKTWSAIDPHPEWSDEEELSVARKLGLRYGPEEKSAILQKLPLKELAKFYGQLRIKHVEFSMNAGGKCKGCSFADARWYITLSRVGSPRGLLLVVEPFFGKITSISE
jgi:hypothetical protein